MASPLLVRGASTRSARGQKECSPRRPESVQADNASALWRLGAEALVEQAKERLGVRLDLLALIGDLGPEVADLALEAPDSDVEIAKRTDHGLCDPDMAFGQPVQELPQRYVALRPALTLFLPALLDPTDAGEDVF